VFLVPIGDGEERRVRGLLDTWLASGERAGLSGALRRTRLHQQFAAYSLLYRALRRIASPMYEIGSDPS
jgi:hypothetical protein